VIKNLKCRINYAKWPVTLLWIGIWVNTDKLQKCSVPLVNSIWQQCETYFHVMLLTFLTLPIEDFEFRFYYVLFQFEILASGILILSCGLGDYLALTLRCFPRDTKSSFTTSFPGTFPWVGGGASLGTRLHSLVSVQGSSSMSLLVLLAICNHLIFWKSLAYFWCT